MGFTLLGLIQVAVGVGVDGATLGVDGATLGIDGATLGVDGATVGVVGAAGFAAVGVGNAGCTGGVTFGL
jgi:hypothetical protein